jgi:cyclopropane fatty-acyl-phospholipid synthase-like methyltransferase
MNKYQITFETWNKVAALYQEKFMDLNLYDDSYDLFCQQIQKKNPSILEIGCGPGNITRYLLAKRPDFQIMATDVAPNMIMLAKKNVPSAEFKVLDAREIDKIESRFDGIVCGFCIPYLSKENVSDLFLNSFELLNPGGHLYFSVIEGDYETSGFETGSSGDQAFVYYYSEAFLKDELAKKGFLTIQIFRINYPKDARVNQSHLIFFARKDLKTDHR